jgi:hypothetical protein
MKMSFFPVVKQPVFSLEPYLLGAWKFSNTITGKGKPMAFGFGVDDYSEWFFGAGVNISF